MSSLKTLRQRRHATQATERMAGAMKMISQAHFFRLQSAMKKSHLLSPSLKEWTRRLLYIAIEEDRNHHLSLSENVGASENSEGFFWFDEDQSPDFLAHPSSFPSLQSLASLQEELPAASSSNQPTPPWAILTLTSSAGLCGGFNQKILMATQRHLMGLYRHGYPVQMIHLGMKGIHRMANYPSILPMLDFSKPLEVSLENSPKFPKKSAFLAENFSQDVKNFFIDPHRFFGQKALLWEQREIWDQWHQAFLAQIAKEFLEHSNSEGTLDRDAFEENSKNFVIPKLQKSTIMFFYQRLIHGLLHLFKKKKISGISIVHGNFHNILQQDPRIEILAPCCLSPLTHGDKIQEGLLDCPSFSTDILSHFIYLYLTNQAWTCYESHTLSEQGARISAMETAKENAKNMLTELNLEYNRLRQAGVTKELMEIVGGVLAMENS